MKLSNSGLQKPLKLSKCQIFSEMLMSANFFVTFQYFHKKIGKKYVFPEKPLIKTKYECQKDENVELQNSL